MTGPATVAACSASTTPTPRPRTVIDLSRRELTARMPGATPVEVPLRWVAEQSGTELAARLAAFLAARRVQRDELDLAYLRQWADEPGGRDLRERALALGHPAG